MRGLKRCGVPTHALLSCLPMNYLAHALLSPDDDRVMVGNIAGDFLRSLDRLAPGIREGVILHRRIDSYSNTHDAFRCSVRRLAPTMGHYARAVIDVFYDYFLARDFGRYAAGQSLEAFVRDVDARFQCQRHLLPEALARRWHDLDWLNSYARVDGIERSLERLSRRSKRGVDLTTAMPLLKEHEQGLTQDLGLLLPDLQRLVQSATPNKESGISEARVSSNFGTVIPSEVEGSRVLRRG